MRSEAQKAARRRDYEVKEMGAQRRSKLKQYGITAEQYDEMFDSQDGHCALCPAVPPFGRKKHLEVDHCHETGRVRGLLCPQCNSSIAKVEKDPDWMDRVKEYLSK